ncbi:MAG: type II toxin-antitoxin system RelE/ParE family toxin [Bacteroidia bacterium]|nr:type II toxin-antitoxin system RelE/ParE family toxin [Bacteroidia bacterium]
MVEINWTPHALEELEAIAAYIERDSPKYASAFVQKMFDEVQRLYNFPKLGRLIPEVANEELREIISGNYRIMYRIATERRIDVLTIHHGARQFPFSLFR